MLRGRDGEDSGMSFGLLDTALAEVDGCEVALAPR